MSCGSRCTIPDIAGTTPDPMGKNSNTILSFQPNKARPHPDFSYLLVSSVSFPSSSHLSFSTINTRHKVKSSLSISQCHDYELTLCTAYTKYSIHQVQHSPSTSYTEYRIHRVLHPPTMVYHPFILTITSWPLNVTSASGIPPVKIDRHQPALHESSNVKSPHHIRTVARVN